MLQGDTTEATLKQRAVKGALVIGGMGIMGNALAHTPLGQPVRELLDSMNWMPGGRLGELSASCWTQVVGQNYLLDLGSLSCDAAGEHVGSEPTEKGVVTGWSVSHVVFYTLLGALLPEFGTALFFVGALWELLETQLECHALSDAVYNCLGLCFGAALRCAWFYACSPDNDDHSRQASFPRGKPRASRWSAVKEPKS